MSVWSSVDAERPGVQRGGWIEQMSAMLTMLLKQMQAETDAVMERLVRRW